MTLDVIDDPDYFVKRFIKATHVDSKRQRAYLRGYVENAVDGDLLMRRYLSEHAPDDAWQGFSTIFSLGVFKFSEFEINIENEQSGNGFLFNVAILKDVLERLFVSYMTEDPRGAV